MKNPASKAIIQEAARGNENALHELIQSITKYVFFRTSYLLRNSMDAEDAAQEVLIRVCEHIRELKNPKAFSAWLSSIVVNETRRYMEKNYKRTADTDVLDYMDSLEEQNEYYLPQAYVDKIEQNRAVSEIIGRLPQRQREAVLLYYYDELSLVQAAKIMEIEHQAVSLYLKLAREKIKNELVQQPEGWMSFAGGMFALPIGSQIKRALSEEAARLIPDTGWADQAWSRYSQAAKATDAKPVQLNAAASNPVLAPVAGIVAVIAVATVGFQVADDRAGAAPPESEPPAIVQVAALPAEGEIMFTGGASGPEHVNPAYAAVWANNELGAMTAQGWRVTEPENESLLYGGDGGSVEDVFAQMRGSGKTGEYILHFSMEDDAGGLYTLSRRFVIQAE